jgi:hypothetical protein
LDWVFRSMTSNVGWVVAFRSLAPVRGLCRGEFSGEWILEEHGGRYGVNGSAFPLLSGIFMVKPIKEMAAGAETYFGSVAFVSTKVRLAIAQIKFPWARKKERPYDPAGCRGTRRALHKPHASFNFPFTPSWNRRDAYHIQKMDGQATPQ